MNNTFIRVMVGIFATAMFATTASASLLVNGGFEDAPFGGAEEPGAGVGWTTFGAPFRVQQTIVDGVICDPISCAGAHGGTVALKIFGVAGAYQDFAAVEGDEFSGGAWAINPLNADVLFGGQIGAVNIEWLDAGGNQLSVSFGETIDSSANQDEWMWLAVSGAAPVGTASARFLIITGDFNGAGGGAARFDDASFDRAAPVPVPAAIWLLGSAMLGMMGMRRKNAA